MEGFLGLRKETGGNKPQLTLYKYTFQPHSSYTYLHLPLCIFPSLNMLEPKKVMANRGKED